MKPRTNLNTLVVYSLNGKPEAFSLEFLKSRLDGNLLADPRGGQMPHINVDTHSLLVLLHPWSD